MTRQLLILLIILTSALSMTEARAEEIKIRFIKSIPDRIDISPIKGNKDDFQYLQF